MNLRGFRAAIVDRDFDQHVFRIGLGVFHKNIEVAVIVEDAGVEQFVLHLFARAPLVGFHQVAIGIFPLRIFVQILHVGMRRRAVDIKVVFLYVFAVVALAVGQAEQAFFQDRVATVPQAPAQSKAAVCRRRFRPSHLRPSGRRASGTGRARSSSTHCHLGCSPREPCPIAVHSGTVPISSRERPAREHRSIASVR